ncbi:SET domain-containing protein [Phaeosphaeriaceae sp. SRC1lsM3a]|nr:SET domain-containing protein [Stagonospora sp. SRC1lsM3a]
MSSQNQGQTIYLTEQEAERIRNTAKERVRKCTESKNNAREPRDAIPSIQQATGASLMADMGGAPDPDMTRSQGGQLPAIAVGQPYPPCSVSVDDLEPMSFSDLKIETHHRGKKLVVKRASPVVGLAVRSWCMVQDPDGKETERLEFGLHKLRHKEEVLELTKSFVLKEPYYTLTEQGEATIRIDHPSDLVSLTDEIADSDLQNATAAEKAATRCKNKGNAALKEQDLLEAYARYSEGLKIANEHEIESLAQDIARNRAYVSLLLGQLDGVLEDAKASLIHGDDQRSKDLDSKAYFRAGSAAYTLAQYPLAQKLFEEQQKLTPGDKDGRIYLKRIAARLREQESGSHDLNKIKINFSKLRPRIDAATFIGPTEVKDSKEKGRGTFATRDIAAGELVLVEKAFCAVYAHEPSSMTAMTYDLRDDKIRMSPVGLSKALVQHLLSNPSQISAFNDLFGDWEGVKATAANDGEPIVDVFRVHDIMSRNAFGLGNQFGSSEENGMNASTALWIRAAYINHSCIPNTHKEATGDLLTIRALTPISAGEELFFTYDAHPDYAARQASLQTTWGFECKCALCALEGSEKEEVRAKREELRGEADAFLERESWAGAKRLSVVKAQKIKKGLEETYAGNKRWEEMPKRAMEGVEEWLKKAGGKK